MLYVPPQDINIFNGEIVNDNGTLRIKGMLTMAEYEEIEQIRLSQYFLIRNDGGDTGEPAPCRQSRSSLDRGHIHKYFTMMCCEMPFRGLAEGLRVWLRAANRDSDRRSKLLQHFGKGMRDYGDGHPQSAAALKPLEPDTLAWYSMLAGIPEPISLERAVRLAEVINGRRPPKPFTL